MMNFLVLTLSLTVAMVLASVILTAAMFMLASNAKVMTWLMNYYMKMLEKSMKNFEKEMDLGA